MIEQQRLRRCFKIKQGYLFLNLINYELQIEYMNPQQEKQLYRVKFEKYLNDNLLNYFSSSSHLYKYLTECPYKIINLTQKRMQIVVTRAYQHCLVTLELQKVEDFDQQYIFRLKMMVMKERINMKKMNNKQDENKIQEINVQMQALLLEAKEKYHLYMLKLDNYKSTLKDKEDQLKQIQEQIMEKTIKLQEKDQKKRHYYTIDD